MKTLSSTLSSGAVCHAAGVHQNTLDRWCASGIVDPVAGGKGSGDHRRFTLSQTVALALAVTLRKRHGAALSFVQNLVTNLGSLSEDDLLRAFDRGKTHTLPVAHTPLVAPQYQGMEDWNVRKVYRSVVKKLGT